MKKIFKFLINEHNKKLWLWVIVCGALLGLFYQSMVVPGYLKNCFKELVRYKYLDLNRKVTEFSLDLPIKDTYLLRLKGGSGEKNQPVEVLINGNLLEEYASKRKQVRGTVYRIIPSHLTQGGQNILTIVCKKKPSYRLGIWCRNYREKLTSRNAFLLFDSSTYLLDHLAEVNIIRGLLIGPLLLSSIWLLISYGSIRLLWFPETKIYSYGLFSFLPSLLMFSVFYLVSVCSPYHILTTKTFFWSYVVLLPAALYCSLISCSIWLKYKRAETRLFKHQTLNRNTVNAISWVEGRELIDKIALLFMFLVVMCAFWLVLGVKIIADFFGNLAYLLLVAVIFIRLFKFLRKRMLKSGKGESDQD